MPRSRVLSLVLLTMLVPGSDVAARTKLAALPEREGVTIRLDNPAATLVEEQRVLTLQQGENQVDFSWRGVTVDPDSIRLEFVSHPDRVQLLSVAYPPGEQALVWRISSAGSYEERVRITYLLGRIDRVVAYRAMADAAETVLDLTGYVVLRNFSGEDFAAARIELDGSRAVTRPTSHGETRQAVLFKAEGVPIRKTFTWDSRHQPWEPKREEQDVGIPVHYEVVNDGASGLGEAALWGGKVRVYQDDNREGSIFLGEDRVEFTPVGGTMKIKIGESRDVAVTRKVLKSEKTNLRPSRQHVVLYDLDEVVTVEVENFKDRPVRVDLVEHIPGQWEMLEADAEWERQDAETVLVHVDVEPSGKKSHRFRSLRRNIRR